MQDNKMYCINKTTVLQSKESYSAAAAAYIHHVGSTAAARAILHRTLSSILLQQDLLAIWLDWESEFRMKKERERCKCEWGGEGIIGEMQ